MISNIFESCSEQRLSDGSDLTVEIFGKNQTLPLLVLKPISGSFTRTIDSTSTSNVQVLTDPQCCKSLGEIGPMGADLVWKRDKCVAWRGPITSVKYSPTGVIDISAADMTYWWGFRTLGENSYIGSDATDAVVGYHTEAMSIDPINNFGLITKPSGVFVTADTAAGDRRIALDAINSLADYAIDYTAYGENVLIGGADLFPKLDICFNDSDWIAPPRVEMRGPSEGFVTRIIALGAGDVEIEVNASPQAQQLYGIIERVEEFREIQSVTDLQVAAQSYLDFYSKPYYLVPESGAQLKPGGPLPFKALIPGIVVRVKSSATCKRVDSNFRISTVTQQASGGVSLELQPEGTIPNA